MITPEAVAEALSDVSDSMRQRAQETMHDTDDALILELQTDALDLQKAEEIGDAETAFSLARRIAGLAILYMARGLA